MLERITLALSNPQTWIHVAAFVAGAWIARRSERGMALEAYRDGYRDGRRDVDFPDSASTGRSGKV